MVTACLTVVPAKESLRNVRTTVAKLSQDGYRYEHLHQLSCIIASSNGDTREKAIAAREIVRGRYNEMFED